jgi:hypothetical protein
VSAGSGVASQPEAYRTVPLAPTATVQASPEVGVPSTAGSMVTVRVAQESTTRTRAPSRSSPARAARSRATRSASAGLGRPSGRDGLVTAASG